jgi:hypothetical protein
MYTITSVSTLPGISTLPSGYEETVHMSEQN